MKQVGFLFQRIPLACFRSVRFQQPNFHAGKFAKHFFAALDSRNADGRCQRIGQSTIRGHDRRADMKTQPHARFGVHDVRVAKAFVFQVAVGSARSGDARSSQGNLRSG